jgi:hypothetical protein
MACALKVGGKLMPHMQLPAAAAAWCTCTATTHCQEGGYGQLERVHTGLIVQLVWQTGGQLLLSLVLAMLGILLLLVVVVVVLPLLALCAAWCDSVT